jgi:hypothetical protein
MVVMFVTVKSGSLQAQWEQLTLTELHNSVFGNVLVIHLEIFFTLHRTILCYMKAAVTPSQ